jgi:hypothetical protein
MSDKLVLKNIMFEQNGSLSVIPDLIRNLELFICAGRPLVQDQDWIPAFHPSQNYGEWIAGMTNRRFMNCFPRYKGEG